MSESEIAVFHVLRESQGKYTYFLLAAAGGAIAFAINETRGLALMRSQALLGLAVLCWALSFFFGCRHLGYVNSILFSNAELLRVQSGQHPLAGSHPQMMAVAMEGIRDGIANQNTRSIRFAKWQFRMLVLGGICYVIWHVYEMYLRRT